MSLLNHILRLCVAMLLSALGASMVLAMPMTTSEVTYFQPVTTHFAHGDDVGFAARAPPIVAVNVEVTGGVAVMRGSAFALRGQETVAALFGFGADLNATNRTFDFAKDADGFVDDVMDFNRTTGGGGNLLNGDVRSIIQSASYYDTPAEQGAAIFRSLVKNHTFVDGNKRTAVEAYQNFAQRAGLPSNLSTDQMLDIATQVANDNLADIPSIINALK